MDESEVALATELLTTDILKIAQERTNLSLDQHERITKAVFDALSDFKSDVK